MTGRPEHPAEILDSGMQSERTYLAWQRTGLGFAANGALRLHASPEDHRALAVTAALTAALCVTGLVAILLG
jgi:uncharacterized membrane protein YidH (DUF202 family)